MHIDRIFSENKGINTSKKSTKNHKKSDFESIRINISSICENHAQNISKNIVQNINEKFDYGFIMGGKKPVNLTVFDPEIEKLNSMLENEKAAMKNLDRMLMINSIVRRLVKGKRLTPEQRQFLRENPDAALEIQMEVAKEKMLQGPERRKNR